MLASFHRLAIALESAGRGDFPKADEVVEVLSPPPGRAIAVVAFTAHFMIATSVPDERIRARLTPGDLLAPMSPRFLTALGDKLDRRDDGIDLVLPARGLQGRSTLRETTPQRRLSRCSQKFEVTADSSCLLERTSWGTKSTRGRVSARDVCGSPVR